MPLEIRELVIKASVGQEEENQTSASPASTGQGADKEAIVKLCVEKVLEILKERSER